MMGMRRSVDNHARLWYAFGLNTSTGLTNVIGFDLDTGEVVVTVDMPFAAPAFAGFGQFVDADPVLGVAYVTGAETMVAWRCELWARLTQHHCSRRDVKKRQFVAAHSGGSVSKGAVRRGCCLCRLCRLCVELCCSF